MEGRAARSGGGASTTDPKFYLVELGRNRCVSILRDAYDNKKDKYKFDNVTGCILYTGRVQRDGHWQVQRRPSYITRESKRNEANKNEHKGYYMHRIAYVAYNGVEIFQTASHLCGNANCFNPYHIHDESQQMNNSRQRCLGYIICIEHRVTIHKLCPHDPPCIKHPVEATQCCVAMTRLPSEIPDSVVSADSPESVALPPTVHAHAPVANLAIPAVQRIETFLDTQHTFPESQFFNTSDDLAEDQIMSDPVDEPSPESDEAPRTTIRDALFSESSTDPPYTEDDGGGSQ